MGGQQVVYKESAWAKVDYVDAEVKELSTKIDAKINSVNESFGQAAEKYNELKEEVIGLKAVVDSLQKIVSGAIRGNALDVGTISGSDQNCGGNKHAGRPPVKWLSCQEMGTYIKEQLKVRINAKDITSALKWYGYIKLDNYSHSSLTEKGKKISWLRNRKDVCVEINPKYSEEIVKIVNEHTDFVDNLERPEQ